MNAQFQTSAAHIYGAGDVIGSPALASVSMEQARVAMCHAFEIDYKTRVAAITPFGIYTIPEISMVGATEEELTRLGVSFEVGRARYENNARGQITGERDGVLKLVFEVPSRKLLGVHIIGDHATELIHVGYGDRQCDDRSSSTLSSTSDAIRAWLRAAYDGRRLPGDRWSRLRPRAKGQPARGSDREETNHQQSSLPASETMGTTSYHRKPERQTAAVYVTRIVGL